MTGTNTNTTNQYPDRIMSKVRQNLGLEGNDTSRDEEINKMSHTEVFEHVLNWEGFLGYTEIVKGWVEDIFLDGDILR